MKKVFISPSYPKPDKADGGIRRVVEAMAKHLPRYGWETVDTPDEADLINIHAGAHVIYHNKPMVHSCHGLYWTDYKWADYYHAANLSVIEAIAMSQAVTAPSNWVSHALTRGMLVSPHTVYHGIDAAQWEPVGTTENNHNYVLWNKARADIISNPNDLNRIAAMMKDTRFISTIGQESPNLNIIGTQPYKEMESTIKNAGVYLATARETFGIGTLEALAAGVPVAGWDFGGQSEIIKDGITGYLAPYGDYEALKDCIIKCFVNRPAMAINARKDALNNWQWSDKIEQYANIFNDVLDEWTKPRPKYSIIVPAHNLGKYLPDALDSVKAQTVKNYECIILDDASTDTTEPRAQEYLNDDRFTYYKSSQNIGLCNIRNWGTRLSNGRYIMYLDADDMIEPDALNTLGNFLDDNQGVHIAYGRIDYVDEQGKNKRQGAPPTSYNWVDQLSHLHQFAIGTSLIRREVLERSGGFRPRLTRAEDAEFIARVTSYGFRAIKATNDPILTYRVRNDSKSATERKDHPGDHDGNWLYWLPWGLAESGKKGKEAKRKGKRPLWSLVPFGAQSLPNSPPHWNISHYQDPTVSVIIPVGPGHDKYLLDTLDSVTAQTLQNWEAIIVNDTGGEIDLSFAPWVKVVTTKGEEGAGRARNLGAKAARSPLLYFLDSDDFMLPNCLESMVKAYIAENGEKYIYTDYIDLQNNGTTRGQRLRAYNQMEYTCQHAVNILINKDDFFTVDGFDESLGGWEDWDLPLKLAVKGLCGHHIKDQTFVYRIYSGTRRTWAVNRKEELTKYFINKFGAYYEGRAKMAKCCGGSQAAQTIIKAKRAIGLIAPIQGAGLSMSISKPKYTRMQYTGTNAGAITFTSVGGKRLSKTYRGSSKESMKYINATDADAALLESSGKWKRVIRAEAAPIPIVSPPIIAAPLTPTPAPPLDAALSFSPVDITPKAKEMADKNGLDISLLIGSGKNGKILLSDIREALSNG